MTAQQQSVAILLAYAFLFGTIGMATVYVVVSIARDMRAWFGRR